MPRPTGAGATRRLVCLVALLSLPILPGLSAQVSVGVGADFVSRYVWRGTDFGESFSVQPGVTIGGGGFEIGAWGSYSVSGDGAGANEADLYGAYTFEAESGASFSFGVTDYYFPSPEPEAGFLSSDAHFIEPFVSISGPESAPLSLFAGMITHGGDNDLYVEGGLGFSLGEAEMGLAVGVVGGKSKFYETDGVAVTNLALSASKELSITESFSLPVSVSYILNPSAELEGEEEGHEGEGHGHEGKGRSFIVFGFSISG